MQDFTFPIALTALIIWSVLLYYLVFFSVRNATREANGEILKQLRIMNRLKIDELDKQGVDMNTVHKTIAEVESNN